MSRYIEYSSVINELLDGNEISISDGASVFDPEMGNSNLLKVMRDRNPTMRLYGCAPSQMDLNYACQKHSLRGKFKVGSTTIDTSSSGKLKFDFIVHAPTIREGGTQDGGNRYKDWMEQIHLNLSLLKPNGVYIGFLPLTWASPSTENGGKLSTLFTSTLDLIEARFNLVSRIDSASVSVVLIRNRPYTGKTKINGKVYNIPNALCIPFKENEDTFPMVMETLNQLVAAPRAAKHTFSHKSSGGFNHSELSTTPTSDCTAFPNADGKKKDLLYISNRKLNSTDNRKKRDRSHVGIPKILLTYHNKARLIVDSKGEMGCMHNIRMTRIDYGYKPDYSQALFNFLTSLSFQDSRKNMEPNLVSLLLRHENEMGEYLSADVLKFIDSYR